MSTWSDAVLALSPSSYWRFEGASPLADSGSAGITLTGVGSPVRVPSIIPSEVGITNNAYDLDGSAMYFTAGDNYDFAAAFGTQKYSIICWFRPDTTTMGSNFERLLEKQDAADLNKGWAIFGANTPADISIVHDYGATDEAATIDANLASGAVYFLAVTYDSSVPEMRYYINGVLQNTDPDWTAAIPNHAQSLAIGARSNGNNKFNGVIDDVAIWNGTVLSTTQIANLWLAANTPYVAAVTSAIADNSGTTVVLDKPAGVAVGDTLYVLAATDGTTSTYTTPSGWTLEGDVADSAHLYLFSRIADGSEGATLTLTADFTYKIGAYILVKGVQSTVTDLTHQYAEFTDTGTGTAHTSPAVTTTESNCLILSAFLSDNTNVDTMAPAGSEVEILDVQNPGFNGMVLGVFATFAASTGTYDHDVTFAPAGAVCSSMTWAVQEGAPAAAGVTARLVPAYQY